ncbi:hypothetical protein RRG08_064329 [Elysia crispata]|uniref:Uncharacterized protein n=1 Tax=Elysia crispata TaxID=231223 RepID=A0AAE0ZYX3_9GAST|nr:hypothetical protein RRG08_064329 [Elysia crispata]
MCDSARNYQSDRYCLCLYQPTELSPSSTMTCLNGIRNSRGPGLLSLCPPMLHISAISSSDDSETDPENGKDEDQSDSGYRIIDFVILKKQIKSDLVCRHCNGTAELVKENRSGLGNLVQVSTGTNALERKSRAKYRVEGGKELEGHQADQNIVAEATPCAANANEPQAGTSRVAQAGPHTEEHEQMPVLKVIKGLPITLLNAGAQETTPVRWMHWERQASANSTTRLDIYPKNNGLVADGCANHHKGKDTLADLSLTSGPRVQRAFFGSEHRKGEADALRQETAPMTSGVENGLPDPTQDVHSEANIARIFQEIVDQLHIQVQLMRIKSCTVDSNLDIPGENHGLRNFGEKCFGDFKLDHDD